jgi:hypothetical protein
MKMAARRGMNAVPQLVNNYQWPNNGEKPTENESWDVE